MFEVDISPPINKVSDCVNIASATCYEQGSLFCSWPYSWLHGLFSKQESHYHISGIRVPPYTSGQTFLPCGCINERFWYMHEQ